MFSLADHFKVNNFDLIRLFAALQVALHHAIFHLGIDDGWIGTILPLIPGVPIFFFVSGFLISRSFEANARVSDYAVNRVLRIYPALIVCTVLSILSVYLTGYLKTQSFSRGHFWFWIAGQATFLQFYPPDFMRAFGTGVLNGSLWTITIELQFYVIVPVLYALLGRSVQSTAQWTAAIIGLVLAFLAINQGFQAIADQYPERLEVKLLKVSFIPWLYMFLLGIVAQRHFESIAGWIEGRAAFWVPLYFVVAYCSSEYLGWRTGNELNPVIYVLLIAAVLSCAYSAPSLADKVLHRNDVSYGIYIYHIPIINLFIYNGYVGGWMDLAGALICTVAAAVISWLLIERPAMKLKRHPFFAQGTVAT
jgi:peptidoglycan/LPS O-acetylase OafA/YrhL